MQKRLVRKIDLQMALSRIEPHPSPKAYLEQYTITPEAAAELLYTASYTYNHIEGKTVADLGCGTGTLAIASALLGAKEPVGVDIDRAAVKTALKNAEKLGVKEETHWVAADVDMFHGTFDTILQNPPFGVQRKKADRKFLKKALEIGSHVYSLHKSDRKNCEKTKKPKRHVHQLTPTKPSSFLKELIESYGGHVLAVYTMNMTIPHMFHFHRRRSHRFLVDMYIIEKRMA